ncbi:uncharacterized protein HMPREF1541_01964 [Cyphellophora europaea CBS 101466]|uniref:Zn(2)-C6 fungal-type domain-containing protein n=1 Tax=Cyphellophora europaea (strain CBS 101466) TaxID=1220924 RepID=W2S269_CYPE1|nr:uncharacterized protein HMPREF1541_01964 [Cyphellophora europaea CBS 101466]ETN42806.1 hypothetical protein HMPREF1541_01964 [Cyphellophora europaea CBS 101466]
MAVASMTPPTQPASNKRKQSAAGISTSGRNVKRRASKACHCCRSRKVRCDVVESGIPCTNCRLDEVECLVTEGKRRRKSYVDGDILHHSPAASVADEKDVPLFPIFDDMDGLNDLSMSLDAGVPASNSMNPLDDTLSQHRPHMIYQTHGHRMTNDERNRRMSAISMTARMPPFNSPSSMPGMAQYFAQQSQRPESHLPAYVRPVGPNIMTEDLAYLERRGAFSFPEPGLRNELLRCYVQYVHPNLPLLNLQDFLAAINNNDPNGTVSLLLFQAVMFAGTGFIDMRYLVAQGYDTRKAARRAYFLKCKALYDLDYELDRAVLVQAVLLMTYWYEAPDDPKDIWHWLGVAISLARTIGMNCDTSKSGMDLKTRHLWKRLWWCCFTRDRLISLGMRRPLRIHDGDSDLPMLELEDFETEAMPLELSRMLGGCPVVKDESKRITLAKMCISLCQLCQIVSPIFDLQYTLSAAKLGLTQETTLRLGPNTAASDATDVKRLDDMLTTWYEEQEQDLHYFVPGTQDRTNSNDGEVISLHRALLTGVYLTLTSALHRPQILPTIPTTFVAPDLQELSRQKMRSAAEDITEIYKDLYASDMIRYLPNTGVSVLLPALIVHMLDLKSPDQAVKQVSARKFQFCMQALQRLREMYASADFAFSFLDAAVRRADVSVPQGGPKTAHPGLQPQEKMAASQPSPPMLTPPPEATWTANRILFASTISPEERKLFTEFTPPKSDSSLNSVMTGGAAVALTDLPISEDGDSESLESQAEQEARHLEEQALHDFDTLINMEGGNEPEMFQEDKNGIYAAMNDAWLNGMNDEQEHGLGNKLHFGDGNDYGITGDGGCTHKNSELQALLDQSASENHGENDAMGGYQEASKMTGDLDADLEAWD